MFGDSVQKRAMTIAYNNRYDSTISYKMDNAQNSTTLYTMTFLLYIHIVQFMYLLCQTFYALTCS